MCPTCRTFLLEVTKEGIKIARRKYELSRNEWPWQIDARDLWKAKHRLVKKCKDHKKGEKGCGTCARWKEAFDEHMGHRLANCIERRYENSCNYLKRKDQFPKELWLARERIRRQCCPDCPHDNYYCGSTGSVSAYLRKDIVLMKLKRQKYDWLKHIKHYGRKHQMYLEALEAKRH